MAHPGSRCPPSRAPLPAVPPSHPLLLEYYIPFNLRVGGWDLEKPKDLQTPKEVQMEIEKAEKTTPAKMSAAALELSSDTSRRSRKPER